jgi:hypothetical protein
MPRFDWSDKAATRIEILEHAKVVFPEFKQSYENAMVRWERELKMKGKFNGQMVGQITGLNGKELGAFIKDFKAQFGSDSSFKDWVLDSNSDAIEAKVKALAGA